MSKEEAIKILKQIDEGDNPLFIKNGHIAMTMAIKALKKDNEEED